MRTISTCLMMIAVFSFSSFTNATCDFTGSWETNWGTLELKSNGTEYTGAYYSDGVKRGTVKAKMSSDWTGGWKYLKGTWEQGKATGKFELKRDCLQKKFTGTWTNDNVDEKGDWYGDQL